MARLYEFRFLLNAIRSEPFLWRSADFTLQGLQPGLDLFCRSTQLARYFPLALHSRKILLLDLGVTVSLLLGCGVGFGGLFFFSSHLFYLSFFSLLLSEWQSPSQGSGTKGWSSMMWLIRARSQNILCRLTVLLGRERPSAQTYASSQPFLSSSSSPPQIFLPLRLSCSAQVD